MTRYCKRSTRSAWVVLGQPDLEDMFQPRHLSEWLDGYVHALQLHNNRGTQENVFPAVLVGVLYMNGFGKESSAHVS